MKTTGGHDWGEPNLDWLGIFYICLAIVSSGFVVIGLLLLYNKRHTTAVRLRGFGSICATVLLLHKYLLLVLLVYPLNGLFKCDIEFFVMSISLPLGIALFQACNIRLFSYYKDQQRLAKDDYLEYKRSKIKKTNRSILGWWKRHSSLERTQAAIAVGICIQVAVTMFLFFSSRSFHGGYGLFSRYVGPGQCRRGVEWIPSVAWQFLWSTVFGPYVLLRTRHIKDTRYWALQTRLAVLACLPGTPLWLAFVYSNDPSLSKINKWFVPAGWFLPGLYAMIFISILFPLLDAHQDKQRSYTPSISSNGSSFFSKGRNSDVSSTGRSREFVSMASLERQISKNIEPLLQWAAQKEFTAENIVFLRAVRDFKKTWGLVGKRGPLNHTQQRDRFEEAALIYFTLVNPETAKFNINIDYSTYEELSRQFASVKYEPFEVNANSKESPRSENIIAPWTNSESMSQKSPTYERPPMVSDVDKLYPVPVTEIRPIESEKEKDVIETSNSSGLQVPSTFSIETFDKAYESVKEDVFFNTWMRFEARNRGLQYP